MRIRLCLLTVCILMTVSLNAQVPCSAITRNPQVLEALLASEYDYAAENAPADVTTAAGQLSELQFSPIVVQAGDALYLEYRGRDFTVYAEYAGGSMTAFDAPEKASFDEWRKGILLLDHRLGLNQRLFRLSAMAQEPQRVEFRNLRIIRAGKPIFELATLASYGSPRLRPAVRRVLPCSTDSQGSVASAAFEPPMAYPPSLPPQPNPVSGLATAPSAAALMFQSGGGSGGNHYKFTGKELDEESGLYNYGARMYSPTMGRFMTPDWSAKPVPVPYADLTNPQTLNLYSYARNNPTNYNDPSGHCSAPSGLKRGQVGICVASFIAANVFYKYGLPGRGDNRITSGHGGSSRIESRVVVDPTNNRVTQTDEIINRSGVVLKDVGPKGVGGTNLSAPTQDDSGNTRFQLSQEAHSSYALGGAVFGNISNHFNFLVTPDLQVGIEEGSSAKDFPSTEAYKYTVDENGNITVTPIFFKQESGDVDDLKKPEKPIAPRSPK